MEIVFTIIFLFAFMLISIFGYQILGDVNTEIQADATFTNESKESLQGLTTDYDNTFDFFAPFILIMLWIVALILAYFTGSNPIFAVFGFLIVVLLAVLGGILGNTFMEIIQDADVSTASASFPMTSFIFDNFMMVVLIMGFSVLITSVVRGAYS